MKTAPASPISITELSTQPGPSRKRPASVQVPGQALIQAGPSQTKYAQEPPQKQPPRARTAHLRPLGLRTITRTAASGGTATYTRPSQLCVRPAPKPSGWTLVNQQAILGSEATARSDGKRKRPQSDAGGASDRLWTRSSSAGPKASASKSEEDRREALSDSCELSRGNASRWKRTKRSISDQTIPKRRDCGEDANDDADSHPAAAVRKPIYDDL